MDTLIMIKVKALYVLALEDFRVFFYLWGKRVYNYTDAPISNLYRDHRLLIIIIATINRFILSPLNVN